MLENARRVRQARNFSTNVPKILDLKSSSEQIFLRKLSLGAPAMALCIPEKNRQSNVPCTLWDEDGENVVECRYGQLSSTGEIQKKTKETRNNTKQNNWPCKSRAALNGKFC